MASQVFRVKLAFAGLAPDNTPVLIRPDSLVYVLGHRANGVILVKVDDTEVEVLECDLENRTEPVTEDDDNWRASS